MKTTKFFNFCLIACAVVVAYNCSGGLNVGKMFTKKWQFDSFKSQAYDREMASLQKQADTTKDSAAKAMLQQNITMATAMMAQMKNITLEYMADGTYQMSSSMMGQTQTIKGKWSITGNGKKVVLTDDKQKTDTLDIVEVTAEKLTVSGKDDKDSTYSITYKAIKS